MESKGSRCFFFRGSICSRIFPCPAKVHDLKFAIPQAKVQNLLRWFFWFGDGGDGGGGVVKLAWGGGLRVLPFLFEHLFNRL